ncbi:MAG: hypothetical protein J07AB43_06480 [Candidatus Nanosalina sp. J07AB43]|nr:MAG: hypothetical protein J07AB43_06480 [Candidatus Nanosalina sp. J07AB43]
MPDVKKRKVMVKAANSNPGSPPYKHLDTLVFPERITYVEDEVDLISLLYLVYRREMKVCLQMSHDGFTTVYKGQIKLKTGEDSKGNKYLQSILFRSMEEKMHYHLGVDPVHPTVEEHNRWLKINNPRKHVSSDFVEEKRKEYDRPD